MRSNLLALALAAAACSDSSPSRAELLAEDLPWPPWETLLTHEAKPLDVVVRTYSESQHGPLQIEVQEGGDGKVYCKISRLISMEQPEDGSLHDKQVVSLTHDAGATLLGALNVNLGIPVAEDAGWFFYFDTTHRTYAYDGAGGLYRETFTLEFEEAERPTVEELQVATAPGYDGPALCTRELEQLTEGPDWNPDPALRESLPTRLIELIEKG